MVAALSPAARADAIAKMAERELDVLVVGGGVVGAGSALDAVTRGLTTAIVEARDWASGTSSRSSKLIHGGLRYLEMLDFGLVSEALHERGLLLDRHRAAPGAAGAVPVPAAAPDLGAALRRRRASRSTTRWPIASGTAHGLKHHRHLTRKRALREAPCLRSGLAHRRHPVLGRAGGRRQAHDDRGAHRRLVRRARGQPGPGDRLPARRASGSPAPRSPTWRPARTSRCGPSRSSTPPGCGPTTPRRWPTPAASSTCARPRASTSSCPATGCSRTPGIILRTEKSVLFVIPWGTALDHRHHRHRLVAGQGAPGRQLAATSTTCSSTSTRCSARR